MSSLDYEIVVAGAGPSGCAAALELAKLNCQPVLLLDKAKFPRPKLCAGGVTSHAKQVLDHLGIKIDLPTVSVHSTRFLLPNGTLTFDKPDHFQIFRRDEFDHYLFRSAEARGIEVRDCEEVDSLTCTPERVIVQTSKHEYRTKILIAADGAKSTVRRILKFRSEGRLMMALEVLLPFDQISLSAFTHNTAVFDFTLTQERFPGYCWIFPAVSGSNPTISVGIMQAPFGGAPRNLLKKRFVDWLRYINVPFDQSDFRGHPALRYEPRAQCSQSRILFIGDAAGIDPLFGEGITSGLAQGVIAAHVAFEALENNNYEFLDYERRIRSSPIGRLMRTRRIAARRLYNFGVYGKQYASREAALRWIEFVDPSRRFWSVI